MHAGYAQQLQVGAQLRGGFDHTRTHIHHGVAG